MDTQPAATRTAPEREQVLCRLRERIVAFAACRISRDAAEDLAQEVLLLVHEKYAQVERLEDLVPLCLRILRFKMMSLVRKSHRRGEYAQVAAEEIPLADPDPTPETLLERREATERLRAAIARLGARCKELFRLKLEGRTFPEIQALLGVNSINTIYTWDFRCRKQLLEWMGGSWERGPRQPSASGRPGQPTGPGDGQALFPEGKRS
jgi:RNA polymerase sigma-70 factor (ECF subfamily)